MFCEQDSGITWGQTFATPYKQMYGVELFRRLKVVSLPYISLQRFAMFAPWRSHNPVRITKSPITGKSFIVTARVTKRPGKGTAIYGLYRYVRLRRVWFTTSLLDIQV